MIYTDQITQKSIISINNFLSFEARNCVESERKILNNSFVEQGFYPPFALHLPNHANWMITVPPNLPACIHPSSSLLTPPPAAMAASSFSW